MTRRPPRIVCALCHQEKPSRRAREYQGAWCRPFDGEGSHTDPQRLDRTGIYVCADCWNAAHVRGSLELPETASEARARAHAALQRAHDRAEQGSLL